MENLAKIILFSEIGLFGGFCEENLLQQMPIELQEQARLGDRYYFLPFEEAVLPKRQTYILPKQMRGSPLPKDDLLARQRIHQRTYQQPTIVNRYQVETHRQMSPRNFRKPKQASSLVGYRMNTVKVPTSVVKQARST